MPATLLEQSEAFDSGGDPDGQVHQKIRSAMIVKAKVIYAMTPGTARDNMTPWANEVLQNPSRLKVEWQNVRRFVFAYHGPTEADKAALLVIDDDKVQTAVDAYVDTRYNPS